MGGRRISVGAAIACLTIVVLGPLVPQDSAQPASRYALTAAIADHLSIDLGHERSILMIDRALYKGHLRSDKAIGQPLLDVPVYLAGRALGAEPAEHLRNKGDLGLWWSTFWSALVPFAALVVLMYRFARRYAPQHALPAALALGFGTMMLPHAVNLYGHVLAALCVLGALVIVERQHPSARQLLVGGALASAAIAVEYHVLIAAAVVFAMVAWREGRRCMWMLAGAVPAGVIVAVYQWRAFGAFWHTPFAYYAGELNGTTSGGYSLPGLHNINDVFVGTRGLLLVSPVVLVAIAAAICLVCTTHGDIRRLATVGLVITGGYLVLCAGWSGTPLLEEPGPRYAIPALPFLVVPLACMWSRWRRVSVLASVVGALFMVAAAFTFILVQIGHTPLTYLRYVSHHDFATTLWSMAFGRFGVVLYLGSIVATVALLLRAFTRHPEPELVR